MSTDRLVDVNDAACRLLGLERDSAIGKTSEEVGIHVPPEERARVGALRRSTGSIMDYPLRYERDGGTRWLSLSASPIEIGGEECILASFVDMTESHASVEALRASEERYRNLFEKTVDGVLVLDGQGVVVELNSAMAQLLGRSAAEVTGTRWKDYVHPDDLSDPGYTHPSVGSGPQRFERRIVRPDGSVVELEIHASSEPGGLFQAVAREVGTRKAGERERALLISAVEQSDDAILVVDRTGAILYLNPAAEHSRGIRYADALGRRYADVVAAAEGAVPEDAFAAAAGEGRWSGEVAVRLADGRRVTRSVTVSAVRDELGEVVNLVLISRDVTRERELEDMLRQSQKMDAIGRLAGGIAHDFNNLLTAIAGFNELARNEAAPESDLATYLAESKTSTDRASRLTRQLLTFGRRAVLSPEVLDLNLVCAEIAPMLRRLIGEDVDLVLSTDAGLPAIRADRGQLELLILNLVVNARDAMPSGGRLTISTSRIPAEAQPAGSGSGSDGADVRVAVADTGSGIDPAILDLIWEPFFTTKPPESSAGLGLAMVFGIVKEAGGRVSVDSTVGVGSTFMVDLPATPPAPQESPAVVRRRAPAAGGETTLVVEDEPAVLGFATKLLEQHGYCVLQAESGDRAIELAVGHPDQIDLLFSDVVMPGTNGYDTAAAIAAARPGIRVLLTSGYSEQTNVRRRLSGSRALLPKPYSGDELLRAVRAALGTRVRVAPGR